MKILRRTIHPETRVVDETEGLVEYVASDETVDSYQEVIRASGWRFDLFRKNAPFVDSHNYESVDRLVGRVVDFRVDKNRLVETVKWAIDVPENTLAQLGYRMTAAGYLRAVSVGFWAVRSLSRWDAQKPELAAEWARQLEELGLDAEHAPRTIYLEQQQVELSACVIGANPNALAKAYQAEVIGEKELAYLSGLRNFYGEDKQNAGSAEGTAAADPARQRSSHSLYLTALAIMARR